MQCWGRSKWVNCFWLVHEKKKFHFTCIMIWKIPPAWACIDLSVKTWQPPAPLSLFIQSKQSVIPLQLIMILSVTSSHSTVCVSYSKQSKPVPMCAQLIQKSKTVSWLILTTIATLYLPLKFSSTGRRVNQCTWTLLSAESVLRV